MTVAIDEQVPAVGVEAEVAHDLAVLDEALRRTAVERPRDDVAEDAAGDRPLAVGRDRERLGIRWQLTERRVLAGREIVAMQDAVAHDRDDAAAVGRERGVDDPLAGAEHVARDAHRGRLVDDVDDLFEVAFGDRHLLQPCERGGRILAQRRLRLQ